MTITASAVEPSQEAVPVAASRAWAVLVGRVIGLAASLGLTLG